MAQIKAAMAFMDYFGIPHESTRRYEARWDDENHKLAALVTFAPAH